MRAGGNYAAFDLGGSAVARPSANAQLSARDRLFNAFAGASMMDPDIATWAPGNWSGQGAITADRDQLAIRLHDLVRNDGWASSGVTKYVDTAVGGGWVLISQPNAKRLGITPEAAAELAGEIEAAWDEFVDDPDCWAHLQRTLPFGLLTALAMRHRIGDGEALGVIMFRERGGPYGTCLNLVDPDRLSNPFGLVDTPTMKAGVELDGDAAPIAYHIRVAHPGDVLSPQTIRWERVERDSPGVALRRQVVHAYEPTRAGEYRGFPMLAPVLKKFKMLGRYDEAEMQAALLNAILAAFITSPNEPDDVAKSLSDDDGADDDDLSQHQADRLDFHENVPIRMGGAKVNYLYSGEDVKFTPTNHPNAVYDPFVRAGLRNIASVIGLTYEQFTGDLSQVNYSSIRAGLIEVKKGFDARKTHFAGQFMQPFFGAWMQEAFARGAIKLPKGAPPFGQAKSAYCSAEWIGPGMGWVDPLKESQAARERLALRLSTRRREAAAQGFRFSQILPEAAREDADMRAAGLDPTVSASKAPASDGSIQQSGEAPPPSPDAPPER